MKSEEMQKIRDEILEDKNLPLFSYRSENNYFPVIGEGTHDAEIVFIGEAPGENEAKTGKPFCGRAGKVLDLLLESIKKPREEVYITNIVKDRPPKNRDPLPEEIEAYSSFLDRQLEIIKPKVIATLGRFSMTYVLNKFGITGETISTAHGKRFAVTAPWGNITIIPLYHPAVAVYNIHMLDALKEDFRVLTKI